MNYESEFLEGLKAAEGSVELLRLELQFVHKYFDELCGTLGDEFLSSHGVRFRKLDYALHLLDDSVPSEPKSVGKIEFDPYGQQFVYSDFRNQPGLPLPPNHKSTPIAIRYFGHSLMYFRNSVGETGSIVVDEPMALNRRTLDAEIV